MIANNDQICGSLLLVLASIRGELVSIAFNEASDKAYDSLIRLRAEGCADLSKILDVVRELISEAEKEQFALSPIGSEYLMKLRFYAEADQPGQHIV